MRRVPLALAILVSALPASAARRDRETVPAAVDAGKPQSCIPIRSIRRSLVRSDRVIDFEVPGRRLYRNILPNSCPRLGYEQRFLYETTLSQLCSTDIITVLYQAPISRGASCGLGQFQPVTLVKR